MVSKYFNIGECMKKLTVAVLAVLLYAMLMPAVSAQETVCGVYITGIGCPHCARADPVLLEQFVNEYPNLVIIEYEIYQQSGNAPLLYTYHENYNTSILGVPGVIFSHEENIIGDTPIINNARALIENLSENGNPCPLPDGTTAGFDSLDIGSLPGKPKIWKKDRVLIVEGELDSTLAKNILESDNLPEALAYAEYEVAEPEPVALSGKNVFFENAVRLQGFTYQWNGQGIEKTNKTINQTAYREAQPSELTLTKILSLAAVDAVNPCAIAVLTLMLIAILTYNPEKKRNVILAGSAFSLAVFVMYLFYGLVIIKFFQIIQALTAARIWLYKILGIAAVVLGLFNIKDFFRYSPGGFATEMPMRLRPRLKKIIEGITSPGGAFVVGIFVTLFLLPCTIGPYIIAGGILSAFELIAAIPWLLLYNLVFVLPMIAITIIIYAGFAKVEDVSGWKEKNIRHLHLIAGIIMFLLGVAMVLGMV